MTNKTTTRKWLNLFFSVFLLIVGSIRIYNFLKGSESTTYKLILSGVFILAGLIGLYEFFNKKENNK
jgi:hypothetical protein